MQYSYKTKTLRFGCAKAHFWFRIVCSMIKSFDQGKFERMFVQPKVVEPEDKVIYLTFDDGPEKYTLRIL